MEDINKKYIDLLNDLIRINNDRIKGYEKAIDDLKGENQYRSFFMERISESHELLNELSDEVNKLGGNADFDATAPGALYRMWMDLKSAFTGGKLKSVLELCEFGEDAALKAYDNALDAKVDWPHWVLSMLNKQRLILQNAHDAVKAYRDTASA